jgi:hypothetical protein
MIPLADSSALEALAEISRQNPQLRAYPRKSNLNTENRTIAPDGPISKIF